MIKNIAKKAGGISLGSAMLLLSLMPATSAFAASVPAVVSVKLSSEQGTVAVGNTVSFTATATQSGSATPMYQFWYEGVHGNWHGTSWSSHNTFSLPALQQGSYEVVVFAKDKGQATSVNSEGTNTNQFVNVDSSATLTAPSLTNVAPGTTLNFTASSKNLTNPVYQLWIQKPDGTWYASGAYQSSPNFSITASTAGDYHAVLYAKDLNAPQTAQFSEYSKATFDAFGQAAAVKLSAASSSLVADGKATDTITATVVDSNGNKVADYNGTIQVADSLGLTGTSGYGLIDSSGNFVAANTATTYQVTNGQVTFKIGASSDASATQTLTTSALSNAPSGVNINYGTLTVNQTAATATQLAITSNVPSLSVNTSGATADLTIQEEDSAGTPVSQGAYMTLTLSGPGSFSPSGSVTSETEYVDGSTMVPVYGEKGVAGNITVTASASGMQSGTITVPAYVNTAPANITLTSKQGTTSSGTPFTLYTVQLVDTNGNPITTGTNADNAITISDNTATVGGTLKYYTVSNGQPTASAEPMSTTLTNGTLQFAVENTTVSSTSPTITVKDTTENFTATAPYTYQVGSPAQVASTNPTLTTGYVEAGHSVTYSVQLEDSNGNPLNTAGQSVVFYFNGTNGAGATLPNGVALTGMSNGYVAQTNSQGVASVTVNVPSAATNASSFQVAAQLQNGTMAAAMGPTETVEPADNFATSMAFGHPSTPSTMTVGTASQTVTGQTVTLDNAVNDQVTTGDQLLVTTSNPSVLALSKYNTGSTTSDTITASSGVATMPTLTGGMAGTATVTVTDLSNPAVPTISETFTVQVGQPSQGTFYLNGQPLGSSNALTVAANTPVALTLYNTDAAGNPVPVTTQEANGDSNGATFALKDTSGTGAFRLTSTGADVTTATIPVGQESVTVYYVNSTAGTYTNDVSASLTSSVVNAANSTVTVPTSVTAGKSMTVSGTVKDVNGNGVGGATVDVLFDGKTGTGTTSSTGTYSVTLTPTKAVSSSPVTVTANGTTISTSSDTTAVTPAVSAAQNIAATETSTGANVTWTAPATGTAASYQVWEINTTTGTKTDIASSVSGSATSYSVNGLTIGDSYEFNVDAVDQYGNVVLGTPSSPAFEYGTLATGAANTAFSANTSSAAGSATFTVTMDKSLPSQTPTLSDFTVKDTTGSITYTVTGVTVSGKTVTITTTIPAGTVAAATDTVVVTGTQGALTDSAGAPSAAFSLSTTN